VRAIFFDENTAQTAVARLVLAGYTAEVVRERLAGEDDEEDHPWAVLSEAPEFVLDLLCEELDGWLDFDDEPSTAMPALPSPITLPTQPKRIKRPTS
jgi:hypothetical protein